MCIKGPRSPKANATKICLLESPKLDVWEIPTNQVIIEEHFREGCFGKVYKGMVKAPSRTQNCSLLSRIAYMFNSCCQTLEKLADNVHYDDNSIVSQFNGLIFLLNSISQW